MSRYFSHLNSASEIINSYNGGEPFASFLRKYFSQHKKYGSKDRKQVGHLCYCYFRLGKAVLSWPVEERIAAGLFLCSDVPNEMLAAIKPAWNENAGLSLKEKYELLAEKNTVIDVFPWKDELSEGIDPEEFSLSFFTQPDLFLRLRPGKGDVVKQKLELAGIEYKTLAESCIALPNSSKIDEVVDLNKEAVVQDYNSQRVGELMKLAINNRSLTVWDCCAASGGKSLMAYDLNPDIKLTVSDIRESILINLRKRFKEAGIKNYESFEANLAEKMINSQLSTFDLVIADVPCTGSGTWSRTPEQLYYFDQKKIAEYASLQKRIISNVIPHIKAGGHFLYITCSVFKKENEELVDFIKQNFHLHPVKMEILKGYDKKADTMFAALFRSAGQPASS